MNDTKKQQNTKKKATITEVIMKRIERDDVSPTPRFMYIFHHTMFWVLWGVTVFLGAVVVSILIFINLNIGWEYYEVTHDSAQAFFVETLPVVWIILFSGMVIVAYYTLRHTKYGYRYSFYLLIFISIGVSIVGGIMLHGYGIGKLIDERYGAQIPFHRQVREFRKRSWMQPNRGLYSGVVELVNFETNKFQLFGYDMKHYMFEMKYLNDSDVERMRVMPDVRIIALPNSDTEKYLIACKVLPSRLDESQTFEHMRDMRRSFREEFVDDDETEINTMAVRNNPCTRLRFDESMNFIRTIR